MLHEARVNRLKSYSRRFLKVLRDAGDAGGKTERSVFMQIIIYYVLPTTGPICVYHRCLLVTPWQSWSAGKSWASVRVMNSTYDSLHIVSRQVLTPRASKISDRFMVGGLVSLCALIPNTDIFNDFFNIVRYRKLTTTGSLKDMSKGVVRSSAHNDLVSRSTNSLPRIWQYTWI